MKGESPLQPTAENQNARAPIASPPPPDPFAALPDSFAALPRLGIGVQHNPILPAFLRANLELVDFVEVMPDLFWLDRGRGAAGADRFEDIDSSSRFLDWLLPRRPVIAHDIGLSIGTAADFDSGYVAQLGRWHARHPFLWHSDHLSFARLPRGDGGGDHHVGLALPVPYDDDVLALIASRIARVQAAVPAPFLLENGVHYVDMPEQDMTEASFLNRLTVATGCGLLLDLHNVYTDARNRGSTTDAFLSELDLERVVEIHVAGGGEQGGLYTDSHAGPVAPPVWSLLEDVAPRARNLRAVTFEFHDSYFPSLGAAGIRAQLERARAVWSPRPR
jgi:uncharacterized protein (UPF0276 family)